MTATVTLYRCPECKSLSAYGHPHRADCALKNLRPRLEPVEYAPVNPEREAAIRQMREALLDSRAALPGSLEHGDDCWQWCWNELHDDAQEVVQSARNKATDAIAAFDKAERRKVA